MCRTLQLKYLSFVFFRGTLASYQNTYATALSDNTMTLNAALCMHAWRSDSTGDRSMEVRKTSDIKVKIKSAVSLLQ